MYWEVFTSFTIHDVHMLRMRTHAAWLSICNYRYRSATRPALGQSLYHLVGRPSDTQQITLQQEPPHRTIADESRGVGSVFVEPLRFVTAQLGNTNHRVFSICW